VVGKEDVLVEVEKSDLRKKSSSRRTLPLETKSEKMGFFYFQLLL
jgi:hypothetical protein